MRPTRLLFRDGIFQSVDVNQLNILMGKNGAGKTRILADLKELFVEDSAHVYFRTTESMPWLYQDKTGSYPSTAVRPGQRLGRTSLRREEFKAEAFFEFEGPLVGSEELNSSSRHSLEDEPWRLLRDAAANAGFLGDYGIGGKSEWFVKLCAFLNALPQTGSPELRLNSSPDRRKTRNSVAPLKGFLDVSILNDVGVVRWLAGLLESPVYVNMRNREGYGSLMVRIPRSEIGTFAAAVGTEEMFISAELGAAGEVHGVKDFVVEGFRHSFDLAGDGLSLSDEVDSPFRNLVGGCYQWDSDVLLPIVEIPNNNFFTSSIPATFVPDSTEQISINMEKIVLEYAEIVAREICDRDADPQVNWLYQRGEAAEGFRFASRKKTWAFETFRIHPAVTIACQVIAACVNERLPDFITQHYSFSLIPLEPRDWTETGRVKFGLHSKPEYDSAMYGASPDNPVDFGGFFAASEEVVAELFGPKPSTKLIDLEALGAGTRRWVKAVISMVANSANSLEIDASRLDEEFYRQFEDTPEVLEDYDSIDEVWAKWECFCESDSGWSLVDFVGLNTRGVLLVDEPEAALHPAGVDSVGRWLENQAVTFGSVFVATHNLRIFDTDFPSTSRLMITAPLHEPRKLKRLDEEDELLTELVEEMGFSPGEVLLLTKYFLMVEGPHDQIVLEGLFGKEFKQASVKIIPLHGLKRAEKSFLDSELAASLKIPMGLLVDNIRLGERTGESKAIDRLLRECESAGKSVDVFPLTKADILDYLPDEVVAEFCQSEFDGWKVARERYDAEGEAQEASRRLDFKSWVRTSYGVELDRESIRKMVSETKRCFLIDEELQRIRDGVVAKAKYGI